MKAVCVETSRTNALEMSVKPIALIDRMRFNRFEHALIRRQEWENQGGE